MMLFPTACLCNLKSKLIVHFLIDVRVALKDYWFSNVRRSWCHLKHEGLDIMLLLKSNTKMDLIIMNDIVVYRF